MRNNTTLCLFTSTKGHFDNSTYQETVDSWLSHYRVLGWGQLLAHIKVSSGHNSEEMSKWLSNKGFLVIQTVADWKHHDNSHHNEYLNDMVKMSKLVNQPYLINLEDDMLLHVNDEQDLGNLIDYAQFDLEYNNSLLEMRFPRFNNEIARIRNLKAKHNIDAEVIENWDTDNKMAFLHSENANLHPCVRRSRDVFIALKLLKDNWDRLSVLGVEQGFSRCFKMLSYEKASLGCFYPEIAQILHIGVKTLEERDIVGKTFDR